MMSVVPERPATRETGWNSFICSDYSTDEVARLLADRRLKNPE